MEKYLGVKLVDAQPFTRGQHSESKGFDKVLTGNAEDEGYQVIYEDGYESWSPKNVFEDAYRKIKTTEDLINVKQSKEYKPFQQRVIDEADALDVKIIALDDFIENNELYKGLLEKEQVRLIQQCRAMEYYFSILVERIENFK